MPESKEGGRKGRGGKSDKNDKRLLSVTDGYLEFCYKAVLKWTDFSLMSKKGRPLKSCYVAQHFFPNEILYTISPSLDAKGSKKLRGNKEIKDREGKQQHKKDKQVSQTKTAPNLRYRKQSVPLFHLSGKWWPGWLAHCQMHRARWENWVVI